MLYMALPGTPLHADLTAEGRMLDERDCPHSDMHGQHRFNYRHPHIRDGRETEYLLRAFQRDFDRNGPSVMRIVRTGLNGWQRYKHHPDGRIRRRFQREIADLAPIYAAAISAAKKYYRHQPGAQGPVCHVARRPCGRVRRQDAALQRLRRTVLEGTRSAWKSNASRRAGRTSRRRFTKPTRLPWPCRATASRPAVRGMSSRNRHNLSPTKCPPCAPLPSASPGPAWGINLRRYATRWPRRDLNPHERLSPRDFKTDQTAFPLHWTCRTLGRQPLIRQQ